MSLDLLVAVTTSLLPVFAFLAGLIVLDSFKLVWLRNVLVSILVGMGIAAACLALNQLLSAGLPLSARAYIRYVAPLVEESAKAAFVVVLVLRHRVGFLVDAAIHGFAIGAGFAFLENIYFLLTLSDASLWTWLLRGFGTAVMQGGATAVVGIVGKAWYDRGRGGAFFWAPGLALAYGLHAVYNHFPLPPWLMTVVLLLVFPLVLFAVFERSEAVTRRWLGVGFDTDQELLARLESGRMEDTPVGAYLATLRDRFSGEVMVDMICLLRLAIELSIRAKGILLMQEAGFRPPPDPDVEAHLAEMRYLERSIGPTGMLALDPVLNKQILQKWQLGLLGKA